MLLPLFGNAPEDVTEENIQSRARGVTLMAVSNKLGGMVVTTGNKSEMAVGYATLYGDMCGGYNVLKDVYKTTVFELCRWRNAHLPEGALGRAGRVIPERIIAKPPSAELQAGPEGRGFAAALSGARRHPEGPDRARPLRRGARRARVTTPRPSTASGACSRAAEYKRRQAPPGVKITSRLDQPGAPLSHRQRLSRVRHHADRPDLRHARQGGRRAALPAHRHGRLPRARRRAHQPRSIPRPDIVLATGDLVEGGKPEEYALLRRLLAPLAMPVYLMPGQSRCARCLARGLPRSRLPAARRLPAVHDRGPAGSPDRPRYARAGQGAWRALRRAARLAARRGWPKATAPTILVHASSAVRLRHRRLRRLSAERGRAAAGRARAATRQCRARDLRPRPSPDPGALGRHHGLDRAQHGAPGDARPARARRRSR